MALLNGDIDMNCSSSNINIKDKTIVDGEGQSTSSTYENNTNKEDHEQNPWNSSLFDDMQLDEVVDEDEQQEETHKQDFDHTWNLDGKNSNNAEDGDAGERQPGRAAANGEEKNKNISEEDVDIFLQNE
nr:uncharacterized protein LOC127341646 isoform X2 [Lolium perenne]